MNEDSCFGCKFLYATGLGWSNYTWLSNEIDCAKGRNLNLPAEEPTDWCNEPDNWPKTNKSKCEIYSPGKMVELDCEGEDGPADHTTDEDVIIAICAHSGRPRNGYK